MSHKFVPDDLKVPLSFIKDKYKLELLSPEVAELDYEAVVSSRERLRNVFGENTVWPADNLTLEDNIKDLERHFKEYEQRKAFTYTVLSISGDRCIGCVYIEPSFSPNYDCEVYLWVRDDELELDPALYMDIQEWIRQDWPFKNPVFPGREISWKEWKYLRPEK
ncbi:MAG: hypothetical protein JW995_11055 [Melioribacteraceae bacterium]|nr:hypothetical protein [Melioribacteraceae bacterium]